MAARLEAAAAVAEPERPAVPAAKAPAVKCS
jgi:hypothetical protein